MSVSKIFKILIVIVACVIIGALVLNVFLPNVVTSLSNAVENSIFSATGMSFDFNGDGTAGSALTSSTPIDNAGAQSGDANGNQANIAGNVDGFQ